MKKDRFESISASPLLAGMAEAELKGLEGIFTEKRLREGSTVFMENMEGESLYLILEGGVKISRMLSEAEERILVILGPEDAFGEMALLDAGPRFATARVVEDARLLCLDRTDFELFCEKNPRLGLKLMRNLARLFAGRVRQNGADYKEMLLRLAGEEE